MIDPVIFTIRIGDFALSVHWYAVFVISGLLSAAWLTAREVRRRGEDAVYVWDGLTWATLAGIIGARLWYVVNDIVGGGTRYLEHPLNIFNTVEGGLHYYGALLFGALAVYLFARKNGLDMWLLLDAVAPGLLLGQAVARPANFINQELYGQPTDLPWGIPIAAQNRMPPWNDLARYPEDTTRFHPAFAYEMVWNFLATGLILWVVRRFKEKMKPGVAFYMWLILAGVGRQIIEFFRPDQPRVWGTDISTSRIVAALMIVAGAVMLLVRYELIRLPFLSPGPETYTLAPSAPSESPQAEQAEETG